jgi:DNA repair exonuclease SbcCD ATPase subunit
MVAFKSVFKEELDKALSELQIQQARYKVYIETKEALKLSIATAEKFLLDSEKARIIVQEVATELQKTLEYRLSSIVTLALNSVGFTYEFKVSFVNRRNQTEVDLQFVKNGNECDPMDSSGGGALDIASLALRMALWSIKKTRAIQILDEPAKFLSRDLQDKASEILKLLSKDLGIQLIVVSHIPEMIESADRVFVVSTDENENSVVKTIR